jgi:hypothetical protein
VPTYWSNSVNKSDKRPLKQKHAVRRNEHRRRMVYYKSLQIRYTVHLVYRFVRTALPSRCVRVFEVFVA